jgi:hypothetical protein
MPVGCPRCAKPLKISETAAGRIGQCSDCNAKFRLPPATGSETAATRPARPDAVSPVRAAKPAAAPRRTDDANRRPAAIAGEAPRAQSRRPAPLEDDDEETTRGTRRRRRYEEDDEDEDEPRRKRRRTSRPARRRSTPIPWGYVYLGVIALFFVALGLALLSGIPQLLLLPGALICTVAGITIIAMAFEDSPVDGILCVVIPLYALYYINNKNPAAYMPFYLNVFGAIYIGTGWFLMERAELAPRPGPQVVANAPAAPVPPPGVPVRPVMPVPAVPVDPNNVPRVNPFEKPPRPVAPKISGDPKIDEALADIESGDVFRTGRAGDKLRRLFVQPELQAVVAEKLGLLAKSAVDETRNAAVEALRSWATTKEVPILIELAGTVDVFKRDDIFVTLTRLKDERAIPLGVQGMKELSSRSNSEKLLRALAPKSVNAMLPLLQDSDHFTVSATIRILQDVGTPDAIPALQAVAAGGNPFHPREAQMAILAIRKRSGR